MAATWSAATPVPTAVNEVGVAGLGSGYGVSGSRTYQILKWPGNKRAVLTRLVGAGTYSTGGDAINPATFGLKEIHAAFTVSSSTALVRTQAGATGTPTINTTVSTAPKVQYFLGNTEATAGGSVAGDETHIVLVGI